MRLAISNHALRNAGGIERYALTLVRGLHARGIRPTVVAKSFDPALAEYAWVDPVCTPVRLAPAKLRDWYFDWRIGRAKRRLGLYPLLACNQTRWSDIGICGSTHPGFLAAMGRRERLSDRWKIALERAHLHNSQVVVAHSNRMRQEAMQWYGVDRAKIELLYPPVDTDRFCVVAPSERARLRRSLGWSDDRAVFVLASTGHQRKGLGLLARWFAQTSLPATLVVAGRAPAAASANLTYLGYRTDMEDIYRAADFTVMASHYEPFGLVGVESVLCGTPVVMADDVGCAEVVREPASIAFSMTEPEGLAQALARAVRRWQDGQSRVAQPLDALAYDPRVATHLDVLLALLERLRPPVQSAPLR